MAELFEETDFKITDHVDVKQGFKALTIRRTEELVAYGLANEQAPVLQTSNARHVEADERPVALRRESRPLGGRCGEAGGATRGEARPKSAGKVPKSASFRGRPCRALSRRSSPEIGRKNIRNR